nr:enhanced serine sensitivity protein SseB C-terminal domain-containing protein [uncultured Mucilaginibacter sp.]
MGLFDWLKSSKSKVEDSTPKLETVLKKAATEPAYRDEFYKLLLSEEVVVLTQSDSLPHGAYTLKEDTTVSIRTLDDGRIPVFTSTDRIFDKGVINSQVEFMAMKGMDLFGLAKGATFILNPYSDYGKELLPEEIERLLNGTIMNPTHQKITIEKETKVLIAQPAIYPQNMVESFKILFKNKPNITAAYLGWIHDPASDIPPHYIIGIDAQQLDQQLVDEASHLAYQYLRADEFIDFISVRDKNGIADYLKTTGSFYSV